MSNASRYTFSIRDVLVLMLIAAVFAALLSMQLGNNGAVYNVQCKNNIAQMAKATNVYQ